ncbi:MAG: DinB family protein [Cytobacillus gottheilii]|uniref:DinB family protein n=1 Tax=Cytobacillus gottheilii TaxID=859144 RepID=UPI00346454DF
MNSRQENLFRQLKTYREEVLHTLENVTDHEAEWIPENFRNNIRWQIGHLYLDQYLWIETLTKENIEIPECIRKSFGFGTSPESFDEETPTYSELKELLKKQPDLILKQYSNCLDKEFPPTEMGMQTIEQVLIRTIFHEGMHLQAINDIKKCLHTSKIAPQV